MSGIRPVIEGDLIFIRDCLNTAISEIELAEQLTDIYDMEDLVDLLREAIQVGDGLLDAAIKKEMEG